jgi:predicted transcriptional regulator
MSAQLRLAVPQTIREQINLADLFHRINRVLPTDQEVVAVPPDTVVRQALETMRQSGYSQLPVMEGQEVLGVFSHRSLATKLSGIDAKKHNPLDVLVEETMDIADPSWFAHVNQELGHVLDALERHDAVLVGEPGRLQGIVTTMDVLRYLDLVSGRFILLGEIELCIRALLRAAMCGEDIAKAADVALKIYEPEERPRRLEEMTFSDYVQLVGHGDLWAKFRPSFGGDRDRTRVKLKTLAELRNDVFHFKRELTTDDDRQLRDGRDWLLMRARCLDARAAIGGQP